MSADIHYKLDLIAQMSDRPNPVYGHPFSGDGYRALIRSAGSHIEIFNAANHELVHTVRMGEWENLMHEDRIEMLDKHFGLIEPNTVRLIEWLAQLCRSRLEVA